MSNQGDRTTAGPAITFVCIAAVALYAGAYLCMVRPVQHPKKIHTFEGGGEYSPRSIATYRAPVGSPGFWSTLFGPANAIDRKLRVEMWPYLSDAFRVDD